MTSPGPSPAERRRRIGWAAVVCLSLAAIGFLMNNDDSFWPAAAMRIGIVMGALWLSLPKTSRPFIEASLTKGTLTALVLVVVFINRLKILLPLMAVLAVAAWIIRPKQRPGPPTHNGLRT